MKNTSKIPLLSIITVCLNAPHLERTCESIVSQTFQDFEWIVIDGGSNAKTLSVLDKYKSRMNYFVSEPDGGIYFGMNKGLRRANGEWVNFMNAGDMFYSNNVLQELFSKKSYEEFDILFGYSHIENLGIPSINEKLDRMSFYHRQPNHHQASFFKRSLFDQFGLYDVSYRIVADWKQSILFFDNGCKFKRINTIIAYTSDSGISMDRVSKLKIFERNRLRAECFNEKEQLSGKIELATIHKQFAQAKARELARKLFKKR